MFRTIADIKQAIKSGTSAASIVEESLSKIAECNDLNAFVEVLADSAREDAHIIDEKNKNGLDFQICFCFKLIFHILSRV